jgi:hypothetical protein
VKICKEKEIEGVKKNGYKGKNISMGEEKKQCEGPTSHNRRYTLRRPGGRLGLRFG